MTNNAMERERLAAEQAAVRERIKRRNRENDKDSDRLIEIADEIHLLEVSMLVGVPDAVRPKWRCVGDRLEQLNDATGTIIKAGRKWATVEFKPGGRWRFRFKDLVPAGTQQNYIVPLAGINA